MCDEPNVDERTRGSLAYVFTVGCLCAGAILALATSPVAKTPPRGGHATIHWIFPAQGAHVATSWKCRFAVSGQPGTITVTAPVIGLVGQATVAEGATTAVVQCNAKITGRDAFVAGYADSTTDQRWLCVEMAKQRSHAPTMAKHEVARQPQSR